MASTCPRDGCAVVLLGILESAGAESEGRPRRRGAPPRSAQPPRPPRGIRRSRPQDHSWVSFGLPDCSCTSVGAPMSSPGLRSTESSNRPCLLSLANSLTSKTTRSRNSFAAARLRIQRPLPMATLRRLGGTQPAFVAGWSGEVYVSERRRTRLDRGRPDFGQSAAGNRDGN
jgi:hypothetical protein